MRIVGGSKTLGKFPTFEKCDRKEILKESRVATTGVEGLGSQSSNL